MSKSNKSSKPKIFSSPNGPYYYFTKFEPKVVEGLTNSKEEKLSSMCGAALCRCGASANKPFCDGSHAGINFVDRKETDGHLDKRLNYVGKKITIHKNRGVCAHLGYCGRGLPAVFSPKDKKGIDPDAASVEEIIEVVNLCPSGSLSYSIDGIEYRDQEREPRIIVSKDGPLYLEGGIEVVGHEPPGEEVSTEHCTLCRCGSSKNKPFCDGTHSDIGFKDENN